jgi:hypothetical protein
MRNSAIAAAMIALGTSLTVVPAQSAGVSIVAGKLPDGRIQTFAIQPDGQIESRWKTSTDPNSGWTEWSQFPTPPGGATTISVGYLSDGRMQLFATNPSGGTFSCWKSSTDPNAQWTRWSRF